MITVSNLFKDYVKQSSREFEARVTIGEALYDKTHIVEFMIDDSLVPSDDFTIGTVISSKLILKIKTNDTIPSNAKIIPEIRLLGAEGPTEWVVLGNFYIDSRKESNGVWEFTCYDRLIVTNQKFVSELTYPAKMSEVITEIATQLDLELDESVVINSSYQIPYKDEEISLHDMLSYIAMAHCASIKLTKDEKIAFVKFSSSDTVKETVLASQHYKVKQLNPDKTYTRVVVTYNADGETLEAGAGDINSTLSLYNPFATQTIVNSILSSITGYSFTPFSMEWKSFLYIESGDRIQIIDKDKTYVAPILTNRILYKGGIRASSTAPSHAEQQSEFKFTGGLFNKINFGKYVQQEVPYYGVVIGKENGLKITKSDGSSQVILNSDKQAFQAMEDGVMVDKIYFDPIAGEYKFIGRLFTEHAIVGIGGNVGSVNVSLLNDTYASFRAAAVLDAGNTSYSLMIGKVATPGDVPEKLNRVDILAGTLYIYDNLFVSGNISAATLGGLPLEDFLASPNLRITENLDITTIKAYDKPILSVQDLSPNIVTPNQHWDFQYASVNNVIKFMTQEEAQAKSDWKENEVFCFTDEDLPVIPDDLSSSSTIGEIAEKVNEIIRALDGWALRRS